MTNDTEERNMKAKNAYTAMLQVVARQPEDEQYRRFSEEVSHFLKHQSLQLRNCFFERKITCQTADIIYISAGA